MSSDDGSVENISIEGEDSGIRTDVGEHRPYLESYNALGHKKRRFATLRIMGTPVQEAMNVVGVSKGNLARWRFEDSFIKSLETNLEDIRDECLSAVATDYLGMLYSKNLFYLSDMIEHFRKKGFDELKQFQLNAFLRAIELTMKAYRPDVSTPQNYEEMILKIRRSHATQAEGKENPQEHEETIRQEGNTSLLRIEK